MKSRSKKAARTVTLCSSEVVRGPLLPAWKKRDGLTAAVWLQPDLSIFTASHASTAPLGLADCLAALKSDVPSGMRRICLRRH